MLALHILSQKRKDSERCNLRDAEDEGENGVCLLVAVIVFKVVLPERSCRDIPDHKERHRDRRPEELIILKMTRNISLGVVFAVCERMPRSSLDADDGDTLREQECAHRDQGEDEIAFFMLPVASPRAFVIGTMPTTMANIPTLAQMRAIDPAFLFFLIIRQRGNHRPVSDIVSRIADLPQDVDNEEDERERNASNAVIDEKEM